MHELFLPAVFLPPDFLIWPVLVTVFVVARMRQGATTARHIVKEDCIIMIPTVSEDAIMAAFYKGQLSEEDIDSMFPAKVSYAFVL